MYRNIARRGGLVAAALVLASCGGGGSSNSPLAAPFYPSISVSGLAATESVTFTVNGSETIVASANGTQTSATNVVGSYTVATTVTPTGKRCAFNNGSTSYTTSEPSIYLVCADTSKGTAVNIGSSASSSFQIYPWALDSSGGPLETVLVSLTDFNNIGLTNATPSNFVFLDSSTEVSSALDSEFKFDVTPITVGRISTQMALALDISNSISESQVDTMKAQVTSFLNGISTYQPVRLSTYQSAPTVLTSFTSDVPTLQAAIAGIDSSPASRENVTNLYGAASDAALALNGVPIPSYMIIVSDGLHNSDDTSETDIADDLRYHLIFAIAVGPNANVDRLQKLVHVDSEQAQPLGRVIQISDMSQLNGALQKITGYVANMMAGLHYINYLTPRRDATEHEFRFQAKPLADCAAGLTILGCDWFTNYDSTGYTSPFGLYVFSNAINPSPGDVVRLHTPKGWDTCSSSSPSYSWTVTPNSGSATGVVVAGTDDTALDLTLDSGGPSNIDVTVTDTTSPGCSGTINVVSN